MRIAASLTLCLFAAPVLATESYTVHTGDTLYQIAKSLKISVSSLQEANGLGPDSVIKDGQNLAVPSYSAVTGRKKSGVYGRALKAVEVWSDNERITSLAKDSTFAILSRDEDEYKVRLSDGRVGWVGVDNVSLRDTRKPVSFNRSWSMPKIKRGIRVASRASGDGVVSAAMALEGARYSSGGLSSRGFDCSGFVKYVYATKGVSLPHSSRALYSCGTPVCETEMKPGDVVFFVGTYRPGISHVGVYIGDSKFIHASTSRGGVRVDDLRAPYYHRRFAGARRM